MKAKSLIRYKIGYDPDKKQKRKSVEVEDGAKLIYVIPIVSGEKDLEFMTNEQIPPYKELTMARAYTGPDKFPFFVQYCSGPFKAAWENELAQNVLHKCHAYISSVRSCVDRNLDSFLWTNQSAEGRTEDETKTQMEKDVS